MKEYKEIMEKGEKVLKPPPKDYKFVGGKADDITVTVAQIFTDEGKDDPRRYLAADDTFFKEQKTVYKNRPVSSKVFDFVKFFYSLMWSYSAV